MQWNVLTQYASVTDGQTNGQNCHNIQRSYSAVQWKYSITLDNFYWPHKRAFPDVRRDCDSQYVINVDHSSHYSVVVACGAMKKAKTAESGVWSNATLYSRITYLFISWVLSSPRHLNMSNRDVICRRPASLWDAETRVSSNIQYSHTDSDLSHHLTTVVRD